jgi:hypothetical protein
MNTREIHVTPYTHTYIERKEQEEIKAIKFATFIGT